MFSAVEETSKGATWRSLNCALTLTTERMRLSKTYFRLRATWRQTCTFDDGATLVQNEENNSLLFLRSQRTCLVV